MPSLPIDTQIKVNKLENDLAVAKTAMEVAQRHLYAATVQFQPTDDAIIMRHVEDAYRAIRECRINLK